MEKSFLFIHNQKWDSNLDCELQVSVQAANKWHIMNNLGRSLTILAVPWILSAVLLSATLALVYKYYWHLGIPNFSLVFFFSFFSFSRMSHAFVKVWNMSTVQSSQMLPIYFHSWVITSPSVGAWRFVCCCQSCLVPCSGLEMWHPVSPFFCFCFLISKRCGTC